MPYITLKTSPEYKQISFEDILFSDINLNKLVPNQNISSTRTYYTNNIKGSMLEKINIEKIVEKLKTFCETHSSLYEADRQTLYHSFPIPKKTGGIRRIDAPCDELKLALTDLVKILSNDIFATYHTSAYAYIKGRSIIDARKKHQRNESMWFLKTDFSNFFGNTTKDFLMRMLSQIFPYSEIIKSPAGGYYLAKALDLCFLNGGLPQGTPASPMLTNLMMIPIDHKISNKLHNFHDRSFIYTRYADDIEISCKIDFDINEVINFMNEVLKEFEAPFEFKPQKTRYGSRNGSNWSLGLMLNKDNNITVGHRNKKRFRAMVNSYLLDRINGKIWSIEDIQSLWGVFSYYHNIEPAYFDELVKYNEAKYGVNLINCFKSDIYNK